MGDAFRLEVVDSLATVTFDLPGEKVNKFSTPVMEEFAVLIDRLAATEGLRAILLRSGKSDMFIAGADIREIEAVEDPADGRAKSALGQQIFDRWSRLEVPTIAAIGGPCLGGGTELALACDYRVVSDSPKTRIGLPEVQLGILPGWGGTQRLPRLIGLAAAIDLIVTGRAVDGRRARRLGLADELVPAPLLDAAGQAYARARFGVRPRRGIRRRRSLAQLLIEATPPGRALLFRKARAAILERTGGNYPAPREALAAVEEGRGRPMAEALAVENAHLGQLIGTPVQRHLLRIFLWTEAVKKENGTASAALRPAAVGRAAVLGAGVMGGGIAQLVADRGIPVRMKDIGTDALAHGFSAAAAVWRRRVQRGRLSAKEFAAKMALVTGGLDYSGFASADVTIEAVVEKLPVKTAVLAEWERAVPAERIFASNTSTLPITEIALGAKFPQRVAGMHFFNPVDRMPLVEVIRGEKTSDDTIATVFDFARRLGKTPVVVRDAPGFLVNRILSPYLAEAVRLLQDGCRIEDIDRAMIAFGMPVGPLALLDDVGIDVAVKAGETMAASFPARLPAPERFAALVEAGRSGRKSGKGFYEYRGTRRAGPSRAAYALLALPRPKQSALPPDVIEARLLMPMINEAAFCLEDGIVFEPSKLDLAMIFGTGFPPFRGGLLQYADDLGIARVVNRLQDLEERLGARFTPARLLVQMAETRGRFYPEKRISEAIR